MPNWASMMTSTPTAASPAAGLVNPSVCLWMIGSYGTCACVLIRTQTPRCSLSSLLLNLPRDLSLLTRLIQPLSLSSPLSVPSIPPTLQNRATSPDTTHMLLPTAETLRIPITYVAPGLGGSRATPVQTRSPDPPMLAIAHPLTLTLLHPSRSSTITHSRLPLISHFMPTHIRPALSTSVARLPSAPIPHLKFQVICFLTTPSTLLTLLTNGQVIPTQALPRGKMNTLDHPFVQAVEPLMPPHLTLFPRHSKLAVTMPAQLVHLSPLQCHIPITPHALPLIPHPPDVTCKRPRVWRIYACMAITNLRVGLYLVPATHLYPLVDVCRPRRRGFLAGRRRRYESLVVITPQVMSLVANAPCSNYHRTLPAQISILLV